MNDYELLDLYTDYLVSAFGAVTSTGLSQLLDAAVSHDRISRMLSRREFTQQDYWHAIKGIVRRVESPHGVIKVDDTIEEKPHSTENEIICWHYDHSKYEVTQRNHIFAAMLAWIKLEILSLKNQSNHYGFKTKLYVKALRAAFDELQSLKQICKNLPGPELKHIPLLG